MVQHIVIIFNPAIWDFQAYDPLLPIALISYNLKVDGILISLSNIPISRSLLSFHLLHPPNGI